MRYIVKASKTHEYDQNHTCNVVVYDGPDFNKARRTMIEYSQYGGTAFESREE